MEERESPPLVAQVLIRGGRHRRKMEPSPLQQGVAPSLTEPVRSNIVVAFDAGTGEVIDVSLDTLPPEFHPEDLPPLAPGRFKALAKATDQRDLANEGEAARLQGPCRKRCETSWNADPWREGRRWKKMPKKHVGLQTIDPKGNVRSGVVYSSSGEALPPEQRFEKRYDEETREVIYKVVEVKPPIPSPRVRHRRKKEPQPSEASLEEKLRQGLPITPEDLPF